MFIQFSLRFSKRWAWQRLSFGLLLFLTTQSATGQFNAKWNQFLPVVVTPQGNGDVTLLQCWNDKVLAVIGGQTFESIDGEVWNATRHTQSAEKVVNGLLFQFARSSSFKGRKSKDGIIWNHIVLLDGIEMPVHDISYGEGWWIAVNENGQIFRSSDLENWRSERTPTASAIQSVVFFKNRLVAASEQRLFTSPRGEFWAIEDFQFRTSRLRPQVAGGVLIDSSTLVLYRSLDGSNWKISERPNRASLVSYDFGDSTLLGVGLNGSCYASSDLGTTWERVPLQGNWPLNTITYFNGRWLLGGDNGVLLIALPVEEPLLLPLPIVDIDRNLVLSWEPPDGVSYLVEDSVDLRSWNLLGRVDPGVGMFNPPVNTRSRFFRLRENR
jgi:hypothetical protein